MAATADRDASPGRLFEDLEAAHDPASKRGGLFTCTTTVAHPGMWRVYLLAQGENMLWPKPWQVWHLKPAATARIIRVSTAQAWASLVRRHHHRARGFLHPDWRALAGIADAVHITPAAVCAIDGLTLITDLGPTAPTYWTVETTLWLRWCFDEAFGTVRIDADAGPPTA